MPFVDGNDDDPRQAKQILCPGLEDPRVDIANTQARQGSAYHGIEQHDMLTIIQVHHVTDNRSAEGDGRVALRFEAKSRTRTIAIDTEGILRLQLVNVVLEQVDNWNLFATD